MKSNPNVYPYTPFRHLNKSSITSVFLPKKIITKKELLSLLSKQARLKVSRRGHTPAERILNIFTDQNICFGPKKYITEHKEELLNRLQFFINKNKPISFTILGFPFKTPVNLKTNRRLPDLGEALALLRLHNLMQLVKSVYRPGGCVTVFTEAPFARFGGITINEANKYQLELHFLADLLGVNKTVRLVNLATLERLVPNFAREQTKRALAFKKKFLAKDKLFMERFQATFPSVFRIVNSRPVSVEILREVYSDKIYENKLSLIARRVYKNLKRYTTEAIFNYFAYLKVRDDFHLIEKKCEGAVPLTVSPKPGRLGIYPIDRQVEILHTHGVPVYRLKYNRFNIEYLYDLQRTGKKYTPMYLVGDKDNKPFFYVEAS
ncbi:MAG: L-tyrosine/L-tryptophan isonitrile synthase family protein [Patescibacteria group bacterium]